MSEWSTLEKRLVKYSYSLSASKYKKGLFALHTEMSLSLRSRHTAIWFSFNLFDFHYRFYFSLINLY